MLPGLRQPRPPRTRPALPRLRHSWPPQIWARAISRLQAVRREMGGNLPWASPQLHFKQPGTSSMSTCPQQLRRNTCCLQPILLHRIGQPSGAHDAQPLRMPLIARRTRPATRRGHGPRRSFTSPQKLSTKRSRTIRGQPASSLPRSALSNRPRPSSVLSLPSPALCRFIHDHGCRGAPSVHRRQLDPLQPPKSPPRSHQAATSMACQRQPSMTPLHARQEHPALAISSSRPFRQSGPWVVAEVSWITICVAIAAHCSTAHAIHCSNLIGHHLPHEASPRPFATYLRGVPRFRWQRPYTHVMLFTFGAPGPPHARPVIPVSGRLAQGTRPGPLVPMPA